MLDILVSYITSFNEPPSAVPLGKALDSFTRQTRHEQTINRLRQIAPALANSEHDSPGYKALKAEKSRLKKTLPAFQFGGVFNGSTQEESLIPGTRTGIVSLDFDADGNPEVSDWPHFRDELFKLPYVFFSALSVSGAGVFALIRVKYPDQQRQHFEQLKRDFAALYERFGFQAIPDKSKGQNVQQLRFLSFDPEAKRRAPEAVTIYDRLPPPPRKRHARSHPRTADQLTGDVFGRAVQVVQQKRDCTFTQGLDMHNSIFHLCKTLNYWGIAQHEAEAFISSDIMPLSQITTNCITDPYRRYAADFGAGALRQTARIAASAPNVRQPNVYAPTMPAPATATATDPETGEIFDYPPEWDTIDPPEPDSAEYAEMLRYEAEAV